MLRRLIYPVPAWPGGDGLSIEQAKGGAHVLHHAAPKGGRTVVYMHGNGSDLASVSPLAALFASRGLGFAAVEYPGYGPASGQRITQGAIVESARDGLDHLLGGGLPVTDIVLVGESLGSAVAARLAADGALAASGDRARAGADDRGGEPSGGSGRLVLVSPFTSMTAMVRQVVRVFPRRLVPDRWETDRLAARIEVPTLLVHGSRDALVPPSMSEALAEQIPDARRVVIEGRDHGNLWEDPSECLEAVAAFARG